MLNNLENNTKTNNQNLYSWPNLINQEKSKPYYQQLSDWLTQERLAGKVIYPPANEVLAALRKTPFEKTKVVILGQDPYHGAGQAHGLSFSVIKGVKIPPSLRNIFKEINQSMNLPVPQHGELTAWAEQGVLLLNTVLTVEHAQPQSHQKKGWEILTDEIIKYLNHSPKPIVFLLWGSPAGKKSILIDEQKHFVLKAPHPSPLSAHRGFFGCDHFRQANHILQENGRKPINWSLPD